MSPVHTPRRFGGRVTLAAFGALAAGAILVPSAALAQSDSDGSSSANRPSKEQMEQRRQCFADHGVNLPERQLDENGKPVRPQGKPEKPEMTDEQKAAYQAAVEACGGPASFPGFGKNGQRGNGQGHPSFGQGGFAPGGKRGQGSFPKLTDEQKACLTEQGIELPSGPKTGDGQRAERPSAEQREKMQAAAEACGLPIPKGGPQQ